MKHLRFPAAVLLFAMLSLLLLFIVLPAKDYSSAERRYLAEPPKVTWESVLNGGFSEDAEKYLADHFPGRNFFVGVNAYWNLLTGRNTASSVYYGKNGYLIRSPEDCSTEQFVTNISRFDGFAKSNGIPASLVMIPTAGDILTDELPANAAPYRYSECLEIAKDTCNSMQVVGLQEPLVKASEEAQVYYKTDHHLTSAGCYAVYSALSRLHGREPLAPEDYTVTAYNGFHGTTWTSSGYWLAKADTLETWDSGADLKVTISEAGKDDIVSDSAFFPQNVKSDDMYTVFLDGNHALVHIENPDVEDGTLLILRDSYGHCIAPFLSESYRDIILVDMRYYRGSVSKLAGECGADELAVIYGLDSLLTDTNTAWLS